MSHRRYIVCAALTALICVAPAWAAPSDGLALAPASVSQQGSAPVDTGKGGDDQLRLVTVGDLIYWQAVANSPDPKLQKVFELVKSGDIAIGNLEGMAFDFRSFSGHQYGSALLWKDAAVPRDLKSIGIDVVSLANNHTMDWGWTGLRDTMRLLDGAGVVYAGVGRNLQQAREPAYLQTRNGLVALISATSTTNAPNEGASDAYRGMPSRPGANLLRWRVVNLLPADQFKMLRRLATARATPYAPAPAAGAREITFGGQLYRLSDHAGLHYEMNQFDLAGLLQAVRSAKKYAKIVIFTIHTHETATGEDDNNPEPPDFLVTLAHDVIDAGANVFLAGGLHSLRGIEVYNGHPIFYGIGSLFLQGKIVWGQEEAHEDDFPGTPAGKAGPPWTWPHKPRACARVQAQGNRAGWYDGIVAVTRFNGGRASAVTLYPLDLGRSSCEQSRRGIPHLADPADARRILSYLQEHSNEFGTRISIEGTQGTISIR